MADVEYSPVFRAQFKARASKQIRAAYQKKLRIFMKNPYDRNLGVHPLSYQWQGHMSFDVTDDFRVIFKRADDGYVFVAFGNHHQLYRRYLAERDK